MRERGLYDAGRTVVPCQVLEAISRDQRPWVLRFAFVQKPGPADQKRVQRTSAFKKAFCEPQKPGSVFPCFSVLCLLLRAGGWRRQSNNGHRRHGRGFLRRIAPAPKIPGSVFPRFPCFSVLCLLFRAVSWRSRAYVVIVDGTGFENSAFFSSDSAIDWFAE